MKLNSGPWHNTEGETKVAKPWQKLVKSQKVKSCASLPNTDGKTDWQIEAGDRRCQAGLDAELTTRNPTEGPSVLN